MSTVARMRMGVAARAMAALAGTVSPAIAAGASEGPVFPPHLTWHLEAGDSLGRAQAPDCGGRALRVAGRVEAIAGDGVVVSQGGARSGWAIVLLDGRLTAFARRDGELFRLAGEFPAPSDGFSFRFEIGEDGTMVLFEGGRLVAHARMEGPLVEKPGDPLRVGSDSAEPVGDYETPFEFSGQIGEVVVSVADRPSDGGAVHGTLRTRWADDVDPDAPWPEYPRPQMIRGPEDPGNPRAAWTNLNGRWQYAIRPRSDPGPPGEWDGEIVVPFPVESQLSGVQRRVRPDERLWYRTSFAVETGGGDKRLLLHFGAVDWEAEVWVDGIRVGAHRGGYDPFTFDVTEAVAANGDGDEDDPHGQAHELVVAVWDPTDTGSQPRGKQVSDPEGIWYTPVTGIWQTVWLERVPAVSIRSVVAVPDLDAGAVAFEIAVEGAGEGDSLQVAVLADDELAGQAECPVGGGLPVKLGVVRPWSPDDPFLYDVGIELVRDGEVVDRVRSYFGLRKIALGRDAQGFVRLCLNNRALFQYGPLDQGWWPDGLYTPPTDDALRHDLEETRGLGFNLVRKHVKVECARWYAHCDRIGLLVWQDMPSGNRHPTTDERVFPGDAHDWERPAGSAGQWRRELEALVDHVRPFPSVVMLVPFNEGWGQFETTQTAEFLRELDRTRLVNAVSGWTDRGGGDVLDLHLYPGPGMEPPAQHPGRAIVLGEFGGLGLPVPGHLWWEDRRNWGYRTYGSPDELMAAYRQRIDDLRPMIHRGLAAAVYTQTTDVEGEVNGLMTYDREVTKFPVKAMRHLHSALYETDPDTSTIELVADAEVAPAAWRISDEPPPGDWTGIGFDDSGWKEAAAPFQSGGLPHVGQGSPWNSERRWMRRTFELEAVPDAVSLVLYAGAEVRVYLNGRVVHEAGRQLQRHYHHVSLRDAAGALRVGTNVLAIEATRNDGGAAIDAGLYGHPFLPASERPPARSRGATPNIVFVFIDDMGFGDLGVTGNATVPTPNLDRLAAEGMRLTQFHVASPICSPSRVAVTTGQYPARWGIHSYLASRQRNAERGMSDFLDPEAPAVARTFRDDGFATAHLGKWHMGGGRDVGEAPVPQAYGFEESLVSFEGLGDRILPPGGLSNQSARLGRGAVRHVAKHDQTAIYVDCAIDFIGRRRHEGRPFYLHLWLNDVHDAHEPSSAQLAKWTHVSENPYEQRFCAVLDEMDRQVGRLLGYLEAAGIADETLVVVTSDNGPTAWPRYYEEGWEPPGSTGGDRGRKWSLYQGGIRMPLIARWPGRIPAGTVNDSVVGAIDLFPTFCALAGVPAPPEAAFDGEDVSRVFLHNDTRGREAPLFWDYGRDPSYLRPGRERDRSPNLAMRDGNWKLLVNDDGSGAELYDLANDPAEQLNLVVVEPERTARMKAAVLEWRTSLR